MSHFLMPTIDIYNLENYTFGTKDAQHEKDKSVPERLARMKDKYFKEGMRRSVDCILLVHQHGHPHILLLQIGNNQKGFFKLPGGRCRPGESEADCIKRKLTKRLAPPNAKEYQPDWEVGECVSVWYRPNFETLFYPYTPPHITKPKECKKLYVIPLPEKCMFAVPRNFHFLAVPLFELYDNSKRYGPIISSIPQVLSHFNFNQL
ncbi:cleavage and polyadenylation specificity factor subunit 5 [Acrasis kona]|uniref:Cleavage and polyadenylation specificity factor subunit 5 n=1 Tax=Acrasis kona TaxID=1008807 RepID=A0AAW2YT14_9EUKA